MSLQGYVGSSQDQTRIRRQEKQREEEKRQIEELKRETEAKRVSAGLRRFGTGTAEVLETAFKNETVGLVTREEFLKKRNNLEERLEGGEKKEKGRQESSKRKQKRPKQQIRAVLSFGDEEEEEEAVEERPEIKVAKKQESDRKEKLSKYGKCPTVETEFLPDAERDRQEKELREQLKQEWKDKQEAIKEEEIEVVYNYWDGTGHRRMLKIKKGDTIGDFLRQAREQLSKDFRELRLTSVENLLYVKEDVMIPHNYTFYDLMLCKARGKSGTLLDFSGKDERHSMEGIESSVGKVVERHWYDKNKHIFPASRWEVYDPDKSYDCGTLHD